MSRHTRTTRKLPSVRLSAALCAAVTPAALLVLGAEAASADTGPCHENVACVPVTVVAPVAAPVSVHDVFVSVNNLLSGN